MCVLGAQKNRLIERVLLSTHNICFGLEIRKIFFSYPPLYGGLTVLKEQFDTKIVAKIF